MVMYFCLLIVGKYVVVDVAVFVKVCVYLIV